MAILKLACEANNTGNIRKYETDEEIYNLIKYTIENSVYSLYSELQPFEPVAECITNQILFLQKCSYKNPENRMIHLILSFDTSGYEQFVIDELESLMMWIGNDFFKECQRLICLHKNNPSHYHLHYLINPIYLSENGYRIKSFYLPSLKEEMAQWLNWLYGIALRGVTYYDAKGRCKHGDEEGAFLYQNKFAEKYGLQKRTF